MTITAWASRSRVQRLEERVAVLEFQSAPGLAVGRDTSLPGTGRRIDSRPGPYRIFSAAEARLAAHDEARDRVIRPTLWRPPQ